MNYIKLFFVINFKLMKTKTFAFDFDGVISEYDGVFKGHEVVGKPLPEVVKAIRILKDQGHKILLYSTRGNGVLKKYCEEHNIPVDYYNENPEYKTRNPGKPVASVYIDDRALLYKGQTAKELVKELTDFKVYYKK